MFLTDKLKFPERWKPNLMFNLIYSKSDLALRYNHELHILNCFGLMFYIIILKTV